MDTQETKAKFESADFPITYAGPAYRKPSGLIYRHIEKSGEYDHWLPPALTKPPFL